MASKKILKEYKAEIFCVILIIIGSILLLEYPGVGAIFLILGIFLLIFLYNPDYFIFSLGILIIIIGLIFLIHFTSIWKLGIALIIIGILLSYFFRK